MLNTKKNTTNNTPTAAAAAEEEAGMTVRQRLRLKRELEEKRKFGLAPLAVDEVSGNEISPNVPQLISQAPWYYGTTGPTLDHQRLKCVDTMDRLQDQHDTVVVLGKAKTYSAGACGNCGSSTHKTSECYKPRKKVGAMYSGKVTSVDMHVERTEKSYAQKRDRYAVGASGVDLLQQSSQEGEEETQATGNLHANGEMIVKKHPRLQDVFATQTAVTGEGAEIKELPKHLHNLDDDSAMFDPKTGSMRGNPNAADPTRTFQGDLQRYRTGDYYTYLDMQLRFLNGESKSIVDFRLDEQLQKQKRQERQQQKDEGNSNNNNNNNSSSNENRSVDTEEEMTRDRLLRSLYGESSCASAENSLRMREAIAGFAAASAASLSSSPQAASSSSLALSSMTTPINLPQVRIGSATRNGHACVYGSYFDREGFRWGYKCCKRLGKDAAACQSTPAEPSVAAKAEGEALGQAS
ncbi:hypothetical protein C3747_31g254 [Trypanosoma cruzi]|uniref:Pre-mRNA-splicing factor SLU7 n=2 Tax=Trypanosoma cruzi TaxID=5693 RepID=Q4DB37_TRYCC|nr:hypothetical protein, conserved [Trypanosoma cruzi]EAN89735.1 hypothetical protein, conserved [Trypanosoma cruzi]KAF8299366.1 hypothetical protein TcYC6_0065210 [Trypanosoma cruzi]PWV15102.1 hypothetical protein C3747_31g254 [Trypanosoma cruzi]RNC57667.1 pre-mRNA-processing factor SLU7 [Trypanosoma cruzi]|eukprot:XP_811586.1 hypothetical protein [Trypanosoma cruzi strain CL Brener]